jgi:hypothetical protein
VATHISALETTPSKIIILLLFCEILQTVCGTVCSAAVNRHSLYCAMCSDVTPIEPEKNICNRKPIDLQSFHSFGNHAHFMTIIFFDLMLECGLDSQNYESATNLWVCSQATAIFLPLYE